MAINSQTNYARTSYMDRENIHQIRDYGLRNLAGKQNTEPVGLPRSLHKSDSPFSKRRK